MNAKINKILVLLVLFVVSVTNLNAKSRLGNPISNFETQVSIAGNNSTKNDSLDTVKKATKVKSTVFIDGQIFTQKEIDEWEYNRSIATYKLLQKKLNLPKKDFTKDENGNLKSLEQIRHELVKIKMDAGNDKLREILKGKLKTSNVMTGMLRTLSKKRKVCMIDILVENACSAEDMNRKYYKMMMDNGIKAEEINRIGNPSHFVSTKVNDTTQEVIEITGGSPVPSQFFISYGDVDGLITVSDKTFPIEIAGLCRDKNGKIVGGVRHVMRNESTGFRIRLQIEFPKATPNKMIKEHQKHLACEFTNWFNVVIDDSNM